MIVYCMSLKDLNVVKQNSLHVFRLKAVLGERGIRPPSL